MTSPTIQVGNETLIRDASYVPRFGIRYVPNSTDVDIQLVRYNSSGVEQETVLTVAGSSGVVTVSSANFQPTATRITGTADQAIAILDSTTHISLNSTTGAKAISTTSSYDGQIITVVADTVSGGSYTLAVTGGTLTFNSAGEAAVIKRVGSAWQVFALTASTSTGANVATIV